MPLRFSPCAARAVERMQAVVQRDEGHRNLARLFAKNQLLGAAAALLDAAPAGIAILTGFPCMLERTPPVETDGPPGAVAVARTLAALGCERLVMLIEQHSEHALRSCAEAPCAVSRVPRVVGFPSSDCWTSLDDARLAELTAETATVFCIERAGQSKDGTCYTMRGRPMGDALVARELNRLVGAEGRLSIAVGDGGNELGLGSVYADVSAHVMHGAKIGCVVPADHLLVASVSNWGGYAISCALSVLAWDAGLRPAAAAFSTDAPTPEHYLLATVPDRDSAAAAILAANAAGAVDGISGASGGSVDGMPLEKQLEVVDELHSIALEMMRISPLGSTCSLAHQSDT